MDDLPSTIAIFVLLLAGSAFFSASETSLTAASRLRLKTREEQGSRAARRALRLADQYDRTLSALLIGNNIVNTLLASLATAFCTRLFSASGVGIATAAVTVLVLIFGEVCPKTYAGAHAEGTIQRVAPLVWFFRLLFWPLSALLRLVQRLVLPKKAQDPTVTEEELRVLFDQGAEEGVLKEERSELLQNALALDDVTVEDILTPRVDLAAVELHAAREEVQAVFLQQHFTRLPVYEGDLDNIVGIVSQKDFFAALVTGADAGLSALLQPCLYVPPGKKAVDLMTELQHRRMRVAVVTDEYGGTAGIVTLEDILEQLVGDIWDEHDQVISPLRPLGGERWEVEGELPVDELFEALCEGEAPPPTEAATVAGLALEHFGHIPQPGERFVCGRLELTVTRVEEQRIRQLQALRLPQAPGAGRADGRPHREGRPEGGTPR